MKDTLRETLFQAGVRQLREERDCRVHGTRLALDLEGVRYCRQCRADAVRQLFVRSGVVRSINPSEAA
jgi:hypothetical protein